MRLKLPISPDIFATLTRWAAELRKPDFAVAEEVLAAIRIPAGTIIEYAGSVEPDGWLFPNGAAVSRTEYADLFKVCGTTYGAGDGSTTFNLPDLRGKFPLGKAVSGTGDALGAAGGALDHTHTLAHTHSLSAHTHTLSHTHSAPAHYHGMGTGADLNITSGGSHTHDTPAGSRFLTYNAAGADGVSSSGGTKVSGNDTNALIRGGDHTHASAAMSGRIGLVTGGVDGNAEMTSGAASSSTTSSPSSDTSGGASSTTSSTNNPPYLVVNYLIKT